MPSIRRLVIRNLPIPNKGNRAIQQAKIQSAIHKHHRRNLKTVINQVSNRTRNRASQPTRPNGGKTQSPMMAHAKGPAAVAKTKLPTMVVARRAIGAKENQQAEVATNNRLMKILRASPTRMQQVKQPKGDALANNATQPTINPQMAKPLPATKKIAQEVSPLTEKTAKIQKIKIPRD